MPVRVEYERGVVGGGVVLADSRRSVVLAAGLERGGVELVDLRAFAALEGDVNLGLGGLALADPEIRVAGRLAQARRFAVLNNHFIAQRRERRRVELFAMLVVADVNADMVDHAISPEGFAMRHRAMFA